MTDTSNNQGTFRKGTEPPVRTEKPPQPKPDQKLQPKPENNSSEQ